jgi:acyl-CoA thioesterase FadM
MRLRLRFLLTLLLAMLRPRISVLEGSSLRLRVLPNDVDILHVTNDRYLAYMDLGRNDLVIRMGLLAAVRRMGAYPVVRTATVRFRRAARLFQRMELRTQIVCWNDEATWFRQEFFIGGRSIALAYCKAEMRTKAGVLATSELLRVAGHAATASPAMPEIVRVLEENEMRLQQEQQEKRSELVA